MLLVRKTTKGLVGMDFSHSYSNHFNVTLGVFDDDGWLEEKAVWGPYGEGRDRIDHARERPLLAAKIAEALDVPLEEADELSGLALQQWRARGGEESERGIVLKGLAFITVAGTGMFIAATASIAAVVFIIILLTAIL